MAISASTDRIELHTSKHVQSIGVAISRAQLKVMHEEDDDDYHYYYYYYCLSVSYCLACVARACVFR